MAGYFSKPFYIIPIYAVFLITGSQLLPHNMSGEEVISVQASVEDVKEVYRLNGRRGRRTYYVMSVNYEAPNKHGVMKLYKDKVETLESLQFYSLNDRKITVFYLKTKPHDVFIDEDLPNAYLFYLQAGVILLVFWSLFYIVWKEPDDEGGIS